MFSGINGCREIFYKFTLVREFRMMAYQICQSLITWTPHQNKIKSAPLLMSLLKCIGLLKAQIYCSRCNVYSRICTDMFNMEERYNFVLFYLSIFHRLIITVFSFYNDRLCTSRPTLTSY